MESFRQIIEFVGSAVDALGVLILIIGALYATISFLFGKQTAADTP